MEYESRQVKWYSLLFFLLFCGATVYLLFSGNPYLYSHVELRSALMVNESRHHSTLPTRALAPEKLGAPTLPARYNLQRTAVDPLTAPRSRSYIEHEHHPLNPAELDFEPSHIAGDESGFYLSGKSPWVAAIGFDGRARWRYKFADLAADRSLLPVVLDENSAYLVHPDGRVVSLDKSSGQLRWTTNLQQEVVGAPFLFGKHILLPGKSTKGVQLMQLQRLSGQLEESSPRLDIKPGFNLSYSPALEAFIASYDNKIAAFDPEGWELLWSQSLTDPVRGPAVVMENAVFVATLGAKIVRLDGQRKGKIEWETDLEKAAAAPPTYLPLMHRLSVLDSAGALNVLDAKTGKLVWRTAIENRGPLVETWSSRLKGNYIEEFKMDWLHKGWTIWTPCSERRFCIFAPGKGQQIQRIQLSGTPLTLPVPGEKRFAFFTQDKPGQYGVSVVLEEGEIKRLKAESTAE